MTFVVRVHTTGLFKLLSQTLVLGNVIKCRQRLLWQRCRSSGLAAAGAAADCWSCGRELREALFVCPCEKGVVLPPSTANHFEIMKCPASFTLDEQKLGDTRKQLQRLLHPDKYSTRSQQEQGFAAEQSAAVNSAYSTLVHPYLRGLYLLELNGLTIDETDNTATETDFLELVMTMNEELSRLASSPNLEELKALRVTNSDHLQRCIQEVSDCFEDGDYGGAKKTLSRMKFHMNIEEQIFDMLPNV